jgi:hypothetical protein
MEDEMKGINKIELEVGEEITIETPHGYIKISVPDLPFSSEEKDERRVTHVDLNTRHFGQRTYTKSLGGFEEHDPIEPLPLYFFADKKEAK